MSESATIEFKFSIGRLVTDRATLAWWDSECAWGAAAKMPPMPMTVLQLRADLCHGSGWQRNYTCTFPSGVQHNDATMRTFSEVELVDWIEAVAERALRRKQAVQP